MTESASIEVGIYIHCNHKHPSSPHQLMDVDIDVPDPSAQLQPPEVSAPDQVPQAQKLRAKNLYSLYRLYRLYNLYRLNLYRLYNLYNLYRLNLYRLYNLYRLICTVCTVCTVCTARICTVCTVCTLNLYRLYRLYQNPRPFLQSDFHAGTCNAYLVSIPRAFMPNVF